MAEVRKEKEISYKCDKCDNGEMVNYGSPASLISDQIPHRCTECGYECTFSTHYPVTKND